MSKIVYPYAKHLQPKVAQANKPKTKQPCGGCDADAHCAKCPGKSQPFKLYANEIWP